MNLIFMLTLIRNIFKVQFASFTGKLMFRNSV